MSELDERTAQLDATIVLLETTRRQRDEALQVLREVRDWRGDKPDWLHDMIDDILAQYTGECK